MIMEEQLAMTKFYLTPPPPLPKQKTMEYAQYQHKWRK
jgi:hypothetical protein